MGGRPAAVALAEFVDAPRRQIWLFQSHRRSPIARLFSGYAFSLEADRFWGLSGR